MRHLNRRYGAVALLLCLTMTQVLRAQQATPPPSGRRSSPSNRPTATQPARSETVNQRAQDLEMLSTVGRRAGTADSSNKRLANQFIEDFDRLVQIYTDTIAPLSTGGSPDYKRISQATAEINQRAKRIKQAVALPLDDKKREKVRYDADAAKLGLMLPELDRVMKSFFENPVFRVNSPNDAELRQAAGRDLEAIIKLSETVSKAAKSPGKPASANN